MRIGMLTQWYDPEPGPAALPGVYAREFVKQGHEVNVLTGFPNYPQGRIYPGYRLRPRAHEGKLPLRVTRVPLFPSHSKSAVGRLANYVSFGASATLLGTGALRGADAIWVYNSPITVALPLLMHSRFGRVPFFLHVQDLWPDSLVESGMFPRGRAADGASRMISALVRLTERRAAMIGVISPSVRQLVLDRNPLLDPRKIIYVPNPTNEQLFVPVAQIRGERQPRPGNVVHVMYVGAIGEVQGLDSLLDAAEILRERTDIHFTLVGDGISRQRLERRVAVDRLRNVTFTGRVAQEHVPNLLADADIQIVSLAAKPFLSRTTPSKIPSLLASGVPIIAQLSGDGASLVENAGAGTVVRPGDSAALADAIASTADGGPELWNNLGRSGRAFYESNLSAAASSQQILSALASMSDDKHWGTG